MGAVLNEIKVERPWVSRLKLYLNVRCKEGKFFVKVCQPIIYS